VEKVRDWAANEPFCEIPQIRLAPPSTMQVVPRTCPGGLLPRHAPPRHQESPGKSPAEIL